MDCRGAKTFRLTIRDKLGLYSHPGLAGVMERSSIQGTRGVPFLFSRLRPIDGSGVRCGDGPTVSKTVASGSTPEEKIVEVGGMF